MVSDNPDSDAVVTCHWLSTAVPASMTVDAAEHELSGMDLAMKLHYLRILYYFHPSPTVAGMTPDALKNPLFLSLDRFRHAAGRIRRDDGGRAQIKCNDSGVRVVEAACERRSIREWLESRTPDRDAQLVPDKVLGPDLSFCPLVFVQLTRFKCGGLAVGFSWAHVLGDAVSALNYINLWGSLLSGNPEQRKPHHSPAETPTAATPAAAGDPLSLKQVEASGDIWLPNTKHRMVTSSFKITGTKLSHLRSEVSSGGGIPAFEAIAALMWKTIAKIRVGKDPNPVTVVRNENDCSEERNTSLSNKQITISTVATSSSSSSSSSLARVEISELAMLISETGKDEKQAIGEMLERDNGKTDFIIYGANLTFVDMERVDLYGLELKGQKPVCVEYNMCGVGEEGAVLVLREPDDADNGGKKVVIILPEHEMPKLKEVLESEWGIA
ncbi:protein ECERIFERUM 26-like [Iris pallida]|uniref:Protein ECERIFERUM 26-like n=1 Tax=Iris pallida TaxID=29817 RepID=A0AAX6EE07_IRIPA|nr:protein ECERIFERUM 26-like [Iris pallida]